MVGNDAFHDIEAEPRAFPRCLRREVGLEDLVGEIVGHAGSAVGDLDANTFGIFGSSDADGALALCLRADGIRRIVEKIRPELVQLRAVRL